MAGAYHTLKEEVEGFYREKGSKFYAWVLPAEDEEAAKAAIAEEGNLHPKSRHVCFAWRLGHDGSEERAADAGEPSGTAGMPILRQLQKFELTQVVAIVIRYFGGTKLGKGGLVNAYRTATEDALAKAKIIEQWPMTVLLLTFPYTAQDAVMKELDRLQAELVDQQYTADCQLNIRLKEEQVEELKKAFELQEEVEIEEQ